MNPSNDPDMNEILAAVLSVPAFNEFRRVETRLAAPCNGDMLFQSADGLVSVAIGGVCLVGLRQSDVPELCYTLRVAIAGQGPLSEAGVKECTATYFPRLVEALAIDPAIQNPNPTEDGCTDVYLNLDMESITPPVPTKEEMDGGYDLTATIIYGVVAIPCSREMYMAQMQFQIQSGERAKMLLQAERAAAFGLIAKQNPDADPFSQSPAAPLSESEAAATGEATGTTEEGFMTGGLADLATRRLH